MSAPIPTEVADITSTWLEGVLQAYAPGARLRSVDVIEAHSGTTGRARVLLAHDDPDLPGSVFVKLAPFDAEQRAFVDQQGMGVAEARFYAEIATDVPVRHPQPFYAAHDDAGRYVMVLEDLHAVGARYPGHSDGDLAPFVERTIDVFAEMHAAFWDSPRFSPTGTWPGFAVHRAHRATARRRHWCASLSNNSESACLRRRTSWPRHMCPAPSECRS